MGGVPQDVKDWLESVAPLHAEQQHTAALAVLSRQSQSA